MIVHCGHWTLAEPRGGVAVPWYVPPHFLKFVQICIEIVRVSGDEEEN